MRRVAFAAATTTVVLISSSLVLTAPAEAADSTVDCGSL